MFIIKHRRIFYAVSVVLSVLSLIAVALWGLNTGVDFRGGSLLEFRYVPAGASVLSVPEPALLKERIAGVEFSEAIGEMSLRKSGENGFILRSRAISEDEKKLIIETLQIEGFGLEEIRFSSVGPILGKEALFKSLWSIALVLLAIIAFIAFAFRKVSEPVSSWKYGLIAVSALVHDIIIPTGVFAYLGHFYGVEVDALFVTAVLVILGFSVHNTIVVFDRTRENLRFSKTSGGKKKDFGDIVGESIVQTIARSINTSLTTLIALFALYFVGPETTRWFSMALIIGIIAGTYSSIFIASPLLLTFERWQASKVPKK